MDIGVTIFNLQWQGPGLEIDLKHQCKGACRDEEGEFQVCCLEASPGLYLGTNFSVGVLVLGDIAVDWALREYLKIKVCTKEEGGTTGTVQWCGGGNLTITGKLVFVSITLLDLPYQHDCLTFKEW